MPNTLSEHAQSRVPVSNVGYLAKSSVDASCTCLDFLIVDKRGRAKARKTIKFHLSSEGEEPIRYNSCEPRFMRSIVDRFIARRRIRQLIGSFPDCALAPCRSPCLEQREQSARSSRVSSFSRREKYSAAGGQWLSRDSLSFAPRQMVSATLREKEETKVEKSERGREF
jgi:hypothetical protein